MSAQRRTATKRGATATATASAPKRATPQESKPQPQTKAAAKPVAGKAKVAEPRLHPLKRRVESLQRRADILLRELRQVLGRTPLNAALLDTMRRGHRVDQAELREWQGRRIAAQHHEQQARELRNQERSLERALQGEQRKQQARIQAWDLVQADELWLQHSWREST